MKSISVIKGKIIIRQLISAVIIILCLFMSGCVASKPVSNINYFNNNTSLENWIQDIATPYLIKELGDNPRFKGKSFLIVNMDKNDVESEIDDLTMQIREDIIDAILVKSGIGLVWKPSIKQLEHHTNVENIECNRLNKEDYYIGIDAVISSTTGKLKVKIRALDIAEKKWITGFAVPIFKGNPSSMQKKSLQKKSPDNYLLGLRPLPFNERQADLLAAYLSRNLSCLFSNMELDEIIVYVKNESLSKIEYFQNAFNLISNYLARYRKVTVTDNPFQANILIKVKVEKIYKGLFQVWVSAKYKKNGIYVPGRETDAYVSLQYNNRNLPEDYSGLITMVSRMSRDSKIHNTIIKAASNVNYISCSTVYDLIKGMSRDSYIRSVIEFFGSSKIIIDNRNCHSKIADLISRDSELEKISIILHNAKKSY